MSKQSQAFTIYKSAPKDTRVINRQKERDKLNAQIKEFQDKGGVIEVLASSFCSSPKAQTGHCQPLM